jgi:ubiquinone/menaquinone biosynthesis C-methylase UbiE
MKALPSEIFSQIASLFYSSAILSAISEAIAPAPGLTLLDVPCGTGTLRSICAPCTYMGVDIDESRVRAARLKFRNTDEFCVGNAAALDYPAGSFDRILAAGLFHHVDDGLAQAILTEFARLLKPSGQVVVFEAIWPRRWYNFIGYVARKMDQGNYVRHPGHYDALFSKRFTVRSREFTSMLGLDYLLETLTPNAGKGIVEPGA